MPSPTGPRRRRGIRAALITGAAVVVLVVGVVLILPGVLADPGAAPDTTVEKASVADQTATVTLSGTLAPREQANAAFAVPGTVAGISVKVGDKVDKGDSLASLEETDLRNAVTLAEANVAAAAAQARSVRDTDGATSAQIVAADAQVDAVQASLTSAQQRLADATLRSPLTGVVAEVSLEVGDQVSGSAAATAGTAGSLPAGVDLSGFGSTADTPASGTAASRIVVIEPDAWTLEATVGTADLPFLAPGQEATVTPTGTNQQISAVVGSVGIVATQSTGGAASFPVNLTITGDDAELFTGSDADAVVITAVVPDVLTVPTEAITYDGETATVLRPDGSVTDVTVGRRYGDRQEILSGLAAGDEVLVPVGAAVLVPSGPGPFGPADPSPSARR
ncbi:MAG: efflux RND transporter periplasmic adaptor subunit [Propioniciclava sp.]